MSLLHRREFLKACAAGGLLVSSPALARTAAPEEDARGWGRLPAIIGRIRPPVFPPREFPVTRLGAVGDNARDNTGAFAATIAACHAAGGGRVVVPPGEFRTGAIHLLSNVALQVEAGATVRFLHDPKKYPTVLTRFEGVEVMNYSPFIYAFEQQNVGIIGGGTIDGAAGCDGWWPWKGTGGCGAGDPAANQAKDRETLFGMAESGVPPQARVFGQGHFLRPQFIEPYRCTNVLIDGVTLVNSPMWNLHPVLCTNVTIRNLRIDSSGPNTDGCDPESCTDVLIRNCEFNTGDDCIAIKSGRNADGRRLAAPSRNIVVQDCQMRNGHGGVTIGSEISGGVDGVYAEHCQMDSPALQFGLRVKNNAMRGGVIEHVFARDVRIGQVSNAAVAIDFYYEEGDRGPFHPVVRDVEISRLTTQKCRYALYLRGFAAAPIQDVTLADCTFDATATSNVVEHVTGLKLADVRINHHLVGTAG